MLNNLITASSPVGNHTEDQQDQNQKENEASVKVSTGGAHQPSSFTFFSQYQSIHRAPKVSQLIKNLNPITQFR
jgi:hypothetical protein